MNDFLLEDLDFNYDELVQMGDAEIKGLEMQWQINLKGKDNKNNDEAIQHTLSKM